MEDYLVSGHNDSRKCPPVRHGSDSRDNLDNGVNLDQDYGSCTGIHRFGIFLVNIYFNYILNRKISFY